MTADTLNPTALLALAERVERPEGHNADLGREVLLALGWTKTCVGYFHGELFHWRSSDRKRDFSDDHFSRYDPTASLDAVVSLISEKLPGWSWACGSTNPDNEPWGCVTEPVEPCADHSGSGADATLALLAATLRALAKEQS